MIRSGILASILVLLAGCADVDALQGSWHGRSAQELQASWGPPSQVYDQDDGGRLLIYRGKDPHLNYRGGEEGHSLVTFRCVVSFRTDAAGTIVSSTAEGSLWGCSKVLEGRPTPTKIVTPDGAR